MPTSPGEARDEGEREPLPGWLPMPMDELLGIFREQPREHLAPKRPPRVADPDEPVTEVPPWLREREPTRDERRAGRAAAMAELAEMCARGATLRDETQRDERDDTQHDETNGGES